MLLIRLLIIEVIKYLIRITKLLPILKGLKRVEINRINEAFLQLMLK